MITRTSLLAVVLLPLALGAQADTTRHPRRWELNGIPALNFDADEGFGYGAIVELYNYGDGRKEPYAFTIQPNVFLTTGGRRDASLFVDAPHLLPGNWRLTANLSREQQLSTPWYGAGNASAYDSLQERAPNTYYYRFGRTKRQLTADFQHGIAGAPLRVLVGGGVSTVALDPTPFDSGATLVQQQFATQPEPLYGWWNSVRTGLVWDTRDREVGPHRGTWTDVLVQRYDRSLGSERSYTRWTATDRRYIPLGEKFTFANRFLLQGVKGDVPLFDLSTVQTSFKQQEGLGGAKTVRGLPRNRYQGKGLFLWNAEMRWHAADFGFMRSHLILTGFADAGRVWQDQPDLSTIFSELHRGYGGGVRLGLGDSFLIAVDVGHSFQSTAPIYIGLGYLF